MSANDPRPYLAHPPLGAAPSFAGYGAPLVPVGTPGLGVGGWRAGSYLCFRQGAAFGSVCPKTNEPASETTSLSFLWRPAWVYVLLVLGFLPYLLAVALTQRRARVVMPLSHAVIQRRKLGMALGIGGFLFFFVSIFGGVVAGVGDLFGVAILVGLLAFVGGLVAMTIMARPFRVVRITRDQIVILDGVHPGYLATLPEGPLPSFD